MTRFFSLVGVGALALLCAAPAARAEDEELPPTSQFFDELDRDGDGCVSQEEFSGGSESFRLLDTNKDGVIKPNELGLPADYKPQPMKKAKPQGKRGTDRRGDALRKALERMDTNKDGRISKDEFLGPPETFARVDRNKDGFLDQGDMGGRGGNPKGNMPNRGQDRGRAQMAKRLRKLDTDGDGKVSRDEYRGPEAFFERLDTNADGFIDGTEIGNLDGRNKQGGPSITPEAAAARFEQLDKNGDGALTADDGVPGRYLEKVDANGDGSVSLEEFQAAVADAQKARDGGNEKSPDKRPRLTTGMLRRYDGDRDGKVSPDEYPGSEERFAALDTDGDGFLTKADMPQKKKAKAP